MTQMVGIGPFITIPLMVATFAGPQAIVGWIAGALLAICDGLVWAELGAAMPGAAEPTFTCARRFNTGPGS
jgi:amino acid transporter